MYYISAFTNSSTESPVKLSIEYSHNQCLLIEQFLRLIHALCRTYCTAEHLQLVKIIKKLVEKKNRLVTAVHYLNVRKRDKYFLASSQFTLHGTFRFSHMSTSEARNQRFSL